MMTRDEILQRVAALAPWFHCIDLGHGIETKTSSATGEPADHPRGTWEVIQRCLPANLNGKSVLDVGCNAGFYSIEAKRRGAARVVGVDAQRHLINQAMFVRRVLDLEIEYRRMSVYDLSRSTVGEFEITLALGLIYHCKHLVLALERLFEVTGELLIIETAIVPTKRELHSFDDGYGSVHPLAYIENPPGTKEAVYNWFLPTPAALEALLRSVGFGEVTLFDLNPTRAVMLARKSASHAETLVPSRFAARLELLEGPTDCAAGSRIEFRLRVQNSGTVRWKIGRWGDRGTVRLGAHLLNSIEEEVVWDFAGQALSRELQPDESESLSISFPAPDTPGEYIVEFDMVLEYLSWFEDLGTQTVKQRIEVR